MHTTACWLTLKRSLVESLPYSVSERQSAMSALLYALKSMATLQLMCDGRDLGTAIGERPPDVDVKGGGRASLEGVLQNTSKEFFEPNLYLFDAYPGGIGFSEPLFQARELLLRRTRELIAGCPCEDGCPSCVGPIGGLAERAKEAAIGILDRTCA